MEKNTTTNDQREPSSTSITISIDAANHGDDVRKSADPTSHNLPYRETSRSPLNEFQIVANATSRQQAKLMASNNNPSGGIAASINDGDALAEALSRSLASVARREAGFAQAHETDLIGMPPQLQQGNEEEEAKGTDSSASSSGEPNASQAMMMPTPTNGSDRDSSTANASGGSARNLVTATQTTSSSAQTTSSGDDGTGSGAGTSGGATSEQSATGTTSSHHHHHHHHHRSRRRGGQETNDGSSLQVPGDDGSNRLREGPATVVASHLPFLPSSDSATNSASSGSGGDEKEPHKHSNTLIQPHREPGFHTIRRSFNKVSRKAPRRDARRGQAKDSMTYTNESSSSSEENTTSKKKHKASKHPPSSAPLAKKKKKAKPSPRTGKAPEVGTRGRGSPSPDSVDSNTGDGEGVGGGSSSGSGTEGGYAGSASSNELGGQNETSSDPSVSSSESRRGNNSKHQGAFGGSSSSEIADFSSGDSVNEVDAGAFTIKTFSQSPSASPSLSSSNDDDGDSSDDREEAYISSNRRASSRKRKAVAVAGTKGWTPGTGATANAKSSTGWSRGRGLPKVEELAGDCPPILTLDSDIMAHVLTFLQPPEILSVLTMPLSKDWRRNFTLQPELWRVFCLVEPFKAKLDDDLSDDDYSSTSDSFCSVPNGDGIQQFSSEVERRRLDRYRLLYTSFVRCMKYLAQIREDAIKGCPPSYIDYGIAEGVGRDSSSAALVGKNKSLRSFLARARGVVEQSKANNNDSSGDATSDSSEQGSTESIPQISEVAAMPRKSKRKKEKGKSKRKAKRAKLGFSIITDRLLRPSQAMDPSTMNLPWSCAIYSIVNWMVTFADVEGIQILCLKVLPFLLEDEQQRMTAQRAGLTDVVLRAMVMFSKSVQLHIFAFHTIVLLARPLGGREGMLFHSSMVAEGIFGGELSQNRKNGVAVMVDSMRRFEDNDVLQSMSCWALVNIALTPSQKAVLVKLGGIQATCNAMMRHPFNAEVQFRALFALINLVIPSAVRLNGERSEVVVIQDDFGDGDDQSEKEILDELVAEIADLVVKAMKNFCSSEAILNRACLVLHNLSLTQEYHRTLLWTPNFYQMLEWCLENYRADQVLQQSATGTLHRLQMTLSSDTNLRSRFSEHLQAQQQASLELAHREAVRLREQQLELQRQEEERAQSTSNNG